jgi:predicted DNA-binding transcriptional regulator AlpA
MTTFKPLDPNQIFRLSEGPKLFGFKPSQIDAKIKKGELPTPLALSATGRARGWTGAQINDHRRKILEQQHEWLRERSEANAARRAKLGEG